jgi:hypothetical protein
MFKLGNMTSRIGLVVIMALALLLGSNFAPSQALAATAPFLGTAQSFAVLGGSTVTNTGSSVIYGNLGVWPGSAVTGFPPGVVVAPGTIHVTDGVALQAQSDVTAAYIVLAGLASTSDLSGQDLGGKTLTPGVYTFSTSAQLTGDPNALFVFQIGSTLTTASDSKVLVINEPPNWCNKYWQVGSSATLGTRTAFQGNILALTSITLNTNARLDGRALARNGAVTLDTNTITVPVCATSTTTKLSATSINSGGSVTDTVTVTGVGYPTGPVDFQVLKPGETTFSSFDATKTLDVYGKVTSNSYTATLPGTYYFRAVYSGEFNYAGSQSGDLDEPLVVTDSRKATSSTGTLLSADSITLGGSVTDNATVAGIFGTPIGTVIFQVSTDGTTFSTYGTTKTLDVNGKATSDTYTPTVLGVSYFRAIYSGDSIYNGSLSGNTEERLITVAVQGPHLSLTKAVSPAVFSQVGDVLYYVLVATNDGNANLDGVSISDLDPGFIITNPGVQPKSLAPGETLTVTGTHTITLDDLYRGFFKNAASASGSSGTSATATEESLRAPSVGGEDGTINKASILAPWLGLGLVLVLGGTVVTVLWLKRRTSS